ncbi:uncharacterized protein ARMOST_07091 [Armillaria ostoyae]|uniref:DUF6535 domain-containing protein n=1 Tax=Armillaria ostoyae TaxID=47428 RepID=A0A284R4U2_ARMOS|nr:uncharacterized protein ARMOST_07091 [Armillaria ostoyae]
MPSIHDIQSDSDDDNVSRASNVSGDDSRPRTPHDNNQPQQSEAENLTSYSRRRRRKSKRKTMGIHRPEYVVRGSDPFDYEQKFPEDKRHKEMGPMARVWRTYLEECGPFDLEMVEGWRDALDVLLVFAGLFSAVVTTFVAQTSQSLQVDYGQVTASLLIELIDVQRSAANGSLVNDIPRSDLTFRPSTSDSWVNGLWFTSLSLSLSTALFAVLTKQWIHQYMSVPSGTPRDRCRLRQFRYMGLQRWGVDLIIGLLPVLMSASLAVFLVGLVLFIIPLRVSIASVVGSVTFLAFAAYLITNFLPILYPSCPYKTPLSQYIFPLYTYITRNISFKWIKLGDDTQADKSSLLLKPSVSLPEHVVPKPVASLPEPVALKDAEIAAVKRYANETDVHALSWLYSMSSNPSVQSIVIQSTSALPLTSVRSLLHHIADFSSTCRFTLRDLLFDAFDGQPTLESKIDRVSRAFLRLPGEDKPTTIDADDWDGVSFGVMSRLKDRFSPDIYAQLLSLQSVTGRLRLDEIWELLLSNLSRDDITLEPIVWARLLHKLLPFGLDDRNMTRIIFQEIPPVYWEANFVCPPPDYEWEEMKIFNTTDCTGKAVNFRMAIQKHLYPWIGECVKQDQLNVTDSIFNPESPDDYPSPQDPRLQFLLTWAGSRSIIVLPNVFREVISNIDAFCGHTCLYRQFGIYPSLPVVPSSHRHAILKMLYTLLSSDHFGKREVPVEHRRAALVLFLRMVESTSPLPPFMARDWCTPDLAAEFVRIAFEDGAWAQIDAFGDRPHLLYELIDCLTRFPPIMNEAFKYAVAKRLFDRLVEKLHYSHDNAFHCIYSSYISTVLETFITGLPPSKSEPQICQKFLGYLHEPDTLFAVCTFLVGSNRSKTLHVLASLCPDDPVWSVCLQRLRECVYPAWMSECRDTPPAAILAELTTFLEGGGVGPFGSKAPSAAEHIAQVDDSSPPVNSPKDPWRNAWRRIRGYIIKDTTHEDISLSSIGTV